jgi:hypothetical protein
LMAFVDFRVLTDSCGSDHDATHCSHYGLDGKNA